MTDISNPIEPFDFVPVRMDFLEAARLCAPSSGESSRSHLQGIFIHGLDKNTIRIVSTDGHRLFVAQHVVDHVPLWAKGGILVPMATMKPELALIEKRCTGAIVMVGSAPGAVHVVLKDSAELCVFRHTVLDHPFPDYQAIIGGSVGAFVRDDDGIRDFERINFATTYLRDVTAVAKVLAGATATDPGIAMYGQTPDSPVAFTFDAEPQAVLYLMPRRDSGGLAGETAQILDPAVKGTLAALRAHETRARTAAVAATTDADRQAALDKADGFAARIQMVQQRTTRAIEPPKGKSGPKAEPEVAAKAPPSSAEDTGKVVDLNKHRPPTDSGPVSSVDAWLAENGRQLDAASNRAPARPAVDLTKRAKPKPVAPATGTGKAARKATGTRKRAQRQAPRPPQRKSA